MVTGMLRKKRKIPITAFIGFSLPQICVILISNSELSHSDFIIPQVEKILYNKPYSIPAIAKVSTEDLNKLEGVYSSEKSNFYIKSIDGQLIFKEGSYPRNALLPLSKTSFQLDEKFTCTFQPDQNGKINTVIIHFWDGTVKTAKRNTDNPTWGIIGNATPSGWDGKDIPLQTDPKNPNIYFLKNYTLKKGNMKFRFNNDWGYNLGLNNDNKSIAFDAYDFPIHEDGVYDIILNMTNIAQPQYSIKKSNP